MSAQLIWEREIQALGSSITRVGKVACIGGNATNKFDTSGYPDGEKSGKPYRLPLVSFKAITKGGNYE